MTWNFYVLFNRISVISGRGEGDYEGLCAMNYHLSELMSILYIIT